MVLTLAVSTACASISDYLSFGDLLGSASGAAGGGGMMMMNQALVRALDRPKTDALQFIKDELKAIKESRKCSEHNASQHYYRGYRDALMAVRDIIEHPNTVT
jgi:hypothetical protein